MTITSHQNNGELAEWSNAVVLKTIDGLSRPGVRIPHSPPLFCNIGGKMMMIILTIICIVIMLILFSISKSLDSINEQLDQIVETNKKLVENTKDNSE